MTLRELRQCTNGSVVHMFYQDVKMLTYFWDMHLSPLTNESKNRAFCQVLGANPALASRKGGPSDYIICQNVTNECCCVSEQQRRPTGPDIA